MPSFTYQAVDSATNRTVSGRMDAESQDQVLARLRESNYKVLDVRAARAGITVGEALRRMRKVKTRELSVFTRQFAVMIDAGMSVVKCLDVLQAQTQNPRFIEVLEGVKNDVRSGHTLAESLQNQAGVFSELYINMVRAAELGGILDIVLARLAGYLEKEVEIVGKIKSAMTYPIMVLCFAVVAVSIIVFKVMPEFKKVFDALQVKLPWSTKLLVGSSTWLRVYFWVPVLIVVVIVVAVRLYGRNEKGRYNIDALKLRVPLVGPLLRKLAISRFARTMGTLISSGIPILRCLEIVADTAGNKVIATAILEARDRVQEGQRLSEPLAKTDVFPVMVTSMMAVGEETGRVDTMLEKVSDFYDEEVDRAIKALTSLIEPLLIVGMGGLVGFIAVSVITPIYDIAANIK